MEITATEQVTRTYCDVCATEITYSSCAGTGDANAKFDYVVCMRTRPYDIDLNDKRGVSISCEMLAKLYTKHPELANATFTKLIEKS